MALSRAARHVKFHSVYETRGLIWIRRAISQRSVRGVLTTRIGVAMRSTVTGIGSARPWTRPACESQCGSYSVAAWPFPSGRAGGCNSPGLRVGGAGGTYSPSGSGHRWQRNPGFLRSIVGIRSVQRSCSFAEPCTNQRVRVVTGQRTSPRVRSPGSYRPQVGCSADGFDVSTSNENQKCIAERPTPLKWSGSGPSTASEFVRPWMGELERPPVFYRGGAVADLLH